VDAGVGDKQIGRTDMPYKDVNKRKEERHNRYMRNRDIDREKAKIRYKNNKKRHGQLVVRRRRGNKELWYNFLLDIGMGKCSICGYNKCQEAIEFHHTDPTKKEMNISQLTYKAFTADNIYELLGEVDKCVVLCANCHREIHNKERR
jgi:hypothetical protein